MSKHRLSPAPLPPSKRQHILSLETEIRTPHLTFESLSDEVILSIFSYLSWVDLCAAQATSGNWLRLATDNELWRNLYLQVFGRSRLRGARGFVGRTDGREVKALPGRAKVEDLKDWRIMFRISMNWINGRCATDDPKPHIQDSQASHILLVGSLTITTTSQSIHLQNAAGVEHALLCKSTSIAHITALALDQSTTSSEGHARIAAFLSSGEFRVFSINHNRPSASCASLSYVPLRRSHFVSPIIQAVYNHPLLITLSEAFTLSMYDLSSGSAVLKETLTSFTSFPPTSMVLSTTSSATYKLVLAYAIPVYPKHWSLGCTELIIAGSSSNSSSVPSSSSFLASERTPLTIISTRNARAVDVPQGWVNEQKLRLMREQWSRKVCRVADTQTDGKWVVLAPEDPTSYSTPSSPSPSSSSPRSTSSPPLSPSYASSSSLYSPSSLQLYRLSLPSSTSISSAAPKLTFVRTLYGQLGPVKALSLSDSRCVSFGANGSIWVWDLDTDMGVEVARPLAENADTASQAKRSVVFDERRIVTAVNGEVVERRFDI